MFHVKHSSLCVCRCPCSCAGLLTGYHRTCKQVKLLFSNHWYGNDADGEADIVVAIAKAGTGNASYSRLLKERESVFTGAQFAPVVDGGVVINIYLFKEWLLFVDLAQLRDETLAAQAIEGP